MKKRLAHKGLIKLIGLIKPMKIMGLMGLVGFMGHSQDVQGQTVVSFNVPTSMCAGSTRTVTFGYTRTHNVVIGEEGSTLGHSERIFLPDGVPCGAMGCSYRSPVTFTAFEPGATITSVEDIKYLRVNMEHSWIGDLYIGITCPNGQKASLLKYGGNGSSSCLSTIPASHRGWASGENVTVGTFLGAAHDGENSSYQCDSNALDNEPGVGWNYCWSNNTTSNYSYAHSSASDDGIIYRYGHTVSSGSEAIIDSSNVAAKTNFYHPDQNFSSLIGCPLNGDWYIEVLDGWSGDNGYIFEWELSLDAELIPQDTCIADSFLVTGYGVTMVNDSTFIISAPQNLTHDTTVYYHYHISSSCGNDIDSTVALTFHPNYINETVAEAVENDLPVVFGGINFYSSTDTSFLRTSIYGCDSGIHYTLTVYPNHRYWYTRAVCDNELPFEWYGYTFTRPDTVTLTLHDIHGADSVLMLELMVNPSYFVHIDTTICDNHPFVVGTTSLNETGIHTVTLTTSEQCDSVIEVSMTALPHHEILLYDTVCKVDGYTLNDTTYHQTGTYQFPYTNSWGCDSIITLHLLVLGEDLKAEIKAIPLLVTPLQPDVRFYDCSHLNVSRRWIINDNYYSDQNFTYTYPVDADSLPVRLIAYDTEGCTDTAIVTILIDRSTMFTPNVFTPNESTNNTWQPGMNDILTMEIWIYSRNGQLVSHLEGIDAKWDGTKDGKSCPQGAYVYTLMYRSVAMPEKQQKTKGTILLLR